MTHVEEADTVDRSLARARTLTRRGAFGEAHQLYSAVIERFPSNRRAMEGLEGLRRRDLTLPKRDQRLKARLASLKRLRSQRPQEALAAARSLAEDYPDVVRVHMALGNVLGERGEHARAAEAFAAAIRRQPTYAPAYFELGNALQRAGQPDAAVEAFAQALEFDPGYTAAMTNLGATLIELNRPREALAVLQRAVAADPHSAVAHLNAGNALRLLRLGDQALQFLGKAVALNPSLANAHTSLASALVLVGRYDDALASHREAVRLEPDNATFHNNLGVTLSDLGRKADARAHYERALALDPSLTHAHHNLSNIVRYTADEPHLATLKTLAAAPLPDGEALYIHFALGKAFDDLDEPDAAFAHFARGNALKSQTHRYDHAQTLAEFEALRVAVSSPPVPEPLTPDSRTERRAIFVLGPPRSGTSLTEQILASHSHVAGGGELNYLERALLGCGLIGPAAGRTPLTRERLARLRDAYLTALTHVGGDERYATDKMPANFRFVGLIALALPDAKIVALERHPMAVCFSIWRQHFTATGLAYAYDMRAVAQYYLAQRALMDHWRTRFPGLIHTVRYERLTEDQEGETRRLLAHCGLPFQTACLAFHENTRAVRTASLDQVRRGLYTGSSDAWRRYAHHLGPMIDTLGEEIARYEAGEPGAAHSA